MVVVRVWVDGRVYVPFRELSIRVDETFFARVVVGVDGRVVTFNARVGVRRFGLVFTIPKNVRERLGIKPGDYVMIKSVILLAPADHVLKGSAPVDDNGIAKVHDDHH